MIILRIIISLVPGIKQETRSEIIGIFTRIYSIHLQEFSKFSSRICLDTLRGIPLNVLSQIPLPVAPGSSKRFFLQKV